MQQLYTTPEAAKLLGIPEGTIRSWLSRDVGVFEVDRHIIIQENGRKLWTEEGIKLLGSRGATDKAAENATATDANSDPKSDAFISPHDFLEEVLENSSTELALHFFDQLPGRTLQRIQRMMQNPTSEEKEVVSNSFQAALATGRLQLLQPLQQLRGLPYATDQTE
jgi:DNA-binding transcriptional MerR regulator